MHRLTSIKWPSTGKGWRPVLYLGGMAERAAKDCLELTAAKEKIIPRFENPLNSQVL